MDTNHPTRLQQLDPVGLRFLLKCLGCEWRVLIDETKDTGRNYVQESIDHTLQRSLGPTCGNDPNP